MGSYHYFELYVMSLPPARRPAVALAPLHLLLLALKVFFCLNFNFSKSGQQHGQLCKPDEG